MLKWLRLVVVVLLLCVALSDAHTGVWVRFLLLLFNINNDKSLNIFLPSFSQTAAQIAAQRANMESVNRILRASKGSVLICLISFFALVHLGLQRNLPSSVANSHHSMDSFMDGDKLVHVINANDLLEMYKFLFSKDTLPKIEKLMKTVDGRAEVLYLIFNNLSGTGTCKHRLCSTFQFGNDNNVQKALYRAAVEHNLRLCIFNDGITMEHLNSPRLLTLPPPIGAPVRNATNMKKNEAYAKSVKPAFYVGDDLDEEDKLSQNGVYPAIGVGLKTEPTRSKLIALREDWEALPQGSKHAVEKTINGYQVTYK